MDQISTDNCALRAQATKLFGPAFPKVEFRIFSAPQRIEVFAVFHRDMEVINSAGQFLDGNGASRAALTPQEFDAGHFDECCQAIKALLGVPVSWHDFASDDVGDAP